MKKNLTILLLMFLTLVQSQTPATGPTNPPVRNAWDVLSQYGSTYTNQSGVYFDSFGGSNIIGDVTLGDFSIVKKYISHSYSGIAPNGANDLNVSAMTHLHIDVWSPDFVSFKVKLEGTNGSNLELEVPFAKNQGSWNSYDIDLSTYSGVSLANLKWIVPVTFNPNNTILYITNVYFYRPATLLPPTVGSFTVAPQSVGAPDFTLTPPTSNNTSTFTYTSSNENVATIVNGNQLHIVGGGSSTITALQVSDGSYGPSSNSTTFVASFPTPGPSPVPPARAANTVVSMFTGTPSDYANVVNAIRAPWTAGTTLTTISNGTNTCLQVDNFGYLGYITDGANFSAVGMTKLHVDVYLNTPIANMFIFLLSNGDQLYNTGALVAGWNSIDINLSNFPGANLADIYGFKFEHNQGAARQIYLDNIYFYVAGSDPIITDFSVPAKVFGDADFTLTTPTSNSAGAFTYTSSNSSVATIELGNQVHITGVGTSIITANQAANGSFDAGSTTATLVVSAPPLAIAAPTPPTRNSYDVVSLYSNAYTNLPSANWVGASSLSDEVIQGNDTKKMSNFIVEFINFAATDVSQMTTLHMDVYTPDCTGFNIWLLNNGDRNAQFFPSLNGWYSVDIPLSTYVNNGLNMTGIVQLKFEGLNGPGKTVYVDNVYFYRSATLPPATVGTFTVPAKNVGDANFTLTPPTSNNSSPFTYMSSNTSIATIVGGNQIQIGTGGTCTITASQVTDGTYGPTSRTASFVVSFPIPGPSPIPPVRQASRVMSLFTGTPSVYTTTPNYDLGRAFWTAGATLTQVPNGTNTALRADNLGYIGLIDTVSERRLNVTGMTNLHLDVYVNAPFANLFFWILTDGDQRRDLVNLSTGWNSINIPLTEFEGANLSNVYGLKFEQNTPNSLQIYLDNIYFSNDTYHIDADGDGYGNPTLAVVGQPVGSVLDATDCDDTRSNVNPGAVDVCFDGLDNDCNGIIDNVGLTGGCIPVVSTIQPSQCGITLPLINTFIYANVVSGAQGYRFRVTDMSNMTVQSIDRALRVVQLTQLINYKFNTTYKIEVAIKYNNVWQPFYGSECSVTTPATTTQVQSTQCGSTLTAMTNVIYADNVPFATGYRFRATNVLTSNVQIIDRSLRDFRMSLLVNPTFNTLYTIEVAVRNTNGTYLPYGPVCNITTPLFPTTSLQNSQCDYTAISNTETFYAISFPGATTYRFKFVNSSLPFTYTFDRSLRTFNLNSIPGLLPSTTYSVQVSIEINGVFGPFGKVCSLTTPGFVARISTSTLAFTAVPYPNPYAENFNLNVTSSSDENITITVYDMIGKQIEVRQVLSTEINSIQIGDTYTTGVYNVIVTQGNESKFVRVIKR